MTHRDRVLTALHRQEPDRVPVDMGSSGVTGIHVTTYEKLLRHLGFKEEILVSDRMQQLAVVHEQVLRRFDIDTRGVGLGQPDAPAIEELPGDSYRDEWGVIRRRPSEGSYYDLHICPFALEATLQALARHRWPDPADEGWTRNLTKQATRLHDGTDYAVVFALVGHFITISQYLRGFEGWFEDLLVNKSFVAELMDRVLDIIIAVADRAFAAVDSKIDVVLLGDDIGIQTGPMISPRVYRELIKPRQKRLFEFIRSKTEAPIVFHTCGSAIEFMQDLIEIGMDVLNPVQVSAAGMDTAALKRRFGDKIGFWGGIDTHRVLPYGTPESVKEEVKKRIRDLAPGGGYVLGSVHNLQPGVPPENICAMFEAALEFGQYGAMG